MEYRNYDTHAFAVDNAVRYGVREAVILNFFAKDTAFEQAHGATGTIWLRYTLDALVRLFPYMTIDQMRTTLNNLVKKGAIIKKQVAESPRDRTMFYALTEDVDRRFL